MSNVSRRSFLKSTGLLTTAAALPSLSSSPRVHAAENNTIKIAWIGCGGRGNGAIRQALNADPNTKLYAVADAFEHRANSAVQGVIDTHGEDRVDCKDRVFHDLNGYRQAIDCLDDGDVVVLTTPQGFRPITFEYAATHKKHINIFAEKPLGVDIPGLKRLQAANEVAKKKGIQVGVGLNNRHYLRTEETVNAIRDGKLGDVLTTWVYRLQGPHMLNLHEGYSDLQNEISNIFCFDWTSGGFDSQYRYLLLVHGRLSDRCFRFRRSHCQQARPRYAPRSRPTYRLRCDRICLQRWSTHEFAYPYCSELLGYVPG